MWRRFFGSVHVFKGMRANSLASTAGVSGVSLVVGCGMSGSYRTAQREMPSMLTRPVIAKTAEMMRLN